MCRVSIASVVVSVSIAWGALAVPANGGNTMLERDGLLGSLEVETNPSRTLEQWRKFNRRYASEASVYEMCDGGGSLCSPPLLRWRSMLASMQGANRYDQISEVNRTVNDLVRYRRDGELNGQRDYWSSPIDSIENGGDCEDIAILKYVSLRELGFTEKQLRLLVVKERSSNLGHALLVVKLKESVLILDNRTDAVKPQELVTAYEPLYSISGKRRWLHLAYRHVSAVQ